MPTANGALADRIPEILGKTEGELDRCYTASDIYTEMVSVGSLVGIQNNVPLKYWFWLGAAFVLVLVLSEAVLVLDSRDALEKRQTPIFSWSKAIDVTVASSSTSTVLRTEYEYEYDSKREFGFIPRARCSVWPIRRTENRRTDWSGCVSLASFAIFCSK